VPERAPRAPEPEQVPEQVPELELELERVPELEPAPVQAAEPAVAAVW